jgi:hypothetical protein
MRYTVPTERKDSVGEAMVILDWYDGPLEGYARCQGLVVHYRGEWSPDLGEDGVHDIFYALTALPREAEEPAARLERLDAEAQSGQARDATRGAQIDALCDQLEALREGRVPTMWATMRWGALGRAIWSMIDEATFIQMTRHGQARR